MTEYIDREKLIERCQEIINEKWNEKVAPISWSHAYSDFIDDIDNTPTEDVTPIKHGKWEDIGDNISDLCFRCSCCEEEFSCEIDMKMFAKYCPNCGAKMDLERGENNG